MRTSCDGSSIDLIHIFALADFRLSNSIGKIIKAILNVGISISIRHRPRQVAYDQQVTLPRSSSNVRCFL